MNTKFSFIPIAYFGVVSYNGDTMNVLVRHFEKNLQYNGTLRMLLQFLVHRWDKAYNWTKENDLFDTNTSSLQPIWLGRRVCVYLFYYHYDCYLNLVIEWNRCCYFYWWDLSIFCSCLFMSKLVWVGWFFVAIGDCDGVFLSEWIRCAWCILI